MYILSRSLAMNKGAFFWENPKTDLGFQIIWILPYQNNGRSEKNLSYTMTTACSPATRDEKNRGGKKQQTDPRGEDNKEKQHKLYV